MLTLDRLGLVMDQRPEPGFLLPGPPADHEQGNLLGERPRHGVHDVVPAGPVGHDEHAHSSTRTRVTVGREADAGLVGQGQQRLFRCF